MDGRVQSGWKSRLHALVVGRQQCCCPKFRTQRNGKDGYFIGSFQSSGYRKESRNHESRNHESRNHESRNEYDRQRNIHESSCSNGHSSYAHESMGVGFVGAFVGARYVVVGAWSPSLQLIPTKPYLLALFGSETCPDGASPQDEYSLMDRDDDSDDELPFSQQSIHSGRNNGPLIVGSLELAIEKSMVGIVLGAQLCPQTFSPYTNHGNNNSNNHGNSSSSNSRNQLSFYPIASSSEGLLDEVKNGSNFGMSLRRPNVMNGLKGCLDRLDGRIIDMIIQQELGAQQEQRVSGTVQHGHQEQQEQRVSGASQHVQQQQLQHAPQNPMSHQLPSLRMQTVEEFQEWLKRNDPINQYNLLESQTKPHYKEMQSGQGTPLLKSEGTDILRKYRDTVLGEWKEKKIQRKAMMMPELLQQQLQVIFGVSHDEQVSTVTTANTRAAIQYCPLL